MLEDTWRTILQDCIVYDLLFKALMADNEKMATAGLKLRYGQVIEKLSIAAEKKHHHFRRELAKLGCNIVSQKNQNGHYIVVCRVKGYIQEAVFSGDLLKAECEVRLLDLVGK